jgi:hypothetical protein
MTTFDTTLPTRPRLTPGSAVLLALCGALLAAVWMGLGVVSAPGLALVLVAALAVLLAGLWYAPWALVALVPILIPLQALANWIRFELAFIALLFVVVVHAIHRRPRWAIELQPAEAANAALILWACFTGFWCFDGWEYFVGIRRLLFGAIAFWLGLRLRHLARRSWFELGLVGVASSLALSALVRRITLGVSEQKLMLDRASATNLGWGTANAIATMLLLLTPLLLVIALRRGPSPWRALAWIAIVLDGLLQVLIASRAATILFVVAVIAQVWGRASRRRWIGVGVAVAALAGLLASPLASGFLERFSNPRDLGSMVVRIWYAREAWRRCLDFFPWGMGVNQGVAYPDHLQGTDPHNYWLVVLSELGVVGVILWTTVLVRIWRAASKVATGPARLEGRALQIAFVVSQLHTLVEPTFQGQQYQFLYFWTLGGWLSYSTGDAGSDTPAADSSRR